MSFCAEDKSFIRTLIKKNGLISKEIAILKSKNKERVFDKTNLESFLSGARITSDRVRFYNNGRDISKTVLSKGKNKLGVSSLYLRNDKLHKAFLRGGTLALDSVNEFTGYLSRTTSELSKLLNCESSANLYVSYGALGGFGEHCDDHHVLVKQVIGKKVALS